ncbi:MAG: DNA primase small subunit domain-containing protein [Nanoarchaeota archaeon]
MYLSKTLSFYKRSDIQAALIEQAQNKEVAVKHYDFFGQRPQTLRYPEDVMEYAKNKATSFHCSEELWQNPLQISTTLRKEELDDMRTGWDLILDIDCGVFEYSKIAAYYTIEALRYCKVESVTIKFSGNKGFHIAVPFEAFPETIDGKPVRSLFPEAPKRIAEYIKFLIHKPAADKILQFEQHDLDLIARKAGKAKEEILQKTKDAKGNLVTGLDIEPFLVIDTILISSRHLYRMPYSFHEKSWLVSVPIDPNQVLSFEKEHAQPENVVVKHPFLDRTVRPGNAEQLLKKAYDYEPKILHEKQKETTYSDSYDYVTEAIPIECFPPCIQLILNGLEDGRKRGLFILTNFLRSCGWGSEQIEALIRAWNPKNREPLKEVDILGHLRYHLERKQKVLPPNCANKAYYVEIGVCKPDNLCARIKNPAQYAKRRYQIQKMNKPKKTVKPKASQVNPPLKPAKHTGLPS